MKQNSGISKKLDKYVGGDKSVEVRFSNLLFLGTGIISLVYVIMSLIIHLPLNATIVCVALAVSLLIMFLISTKTHKEVLVGQVSLIIMNFIFFPAIFIVTGGIYGGAVSFFVLGVVFSYLLFTGKICWTVITIETLFYCFIIFASYKWDTHTYIYDDVAYTYFLSATNVIITALAIGLLVRVLISQYRKEKDKIENAVQELEFLSTKDPLTGVYNRRYMLDFLEKNIKRSNDYGALLSVVIFDIDYFKSLNDDFGHLVGDEILKNLCEVFSSQIRSSDIMSRYGGEEFVAVFPNTNADTAYKRAEQIREKVEESTLSKSVNRPITISGGVAQYIKGMTIEELIDAADKNLYFAKSSGRNCVCVGREDDAEGYEKK